MSVSTSSVLLNLADFCEKSCINCKFHKFRLPRNHKLSLSELLEHSEFEKFDEYILSCNYKELPEFERTISIFHENGKNLSIVLNAPLKEDDNTRELLPLFKKVYLKTKHLNKDNLIDYLKLDSQFNNVNYLIDEESSQAFFQKLLLLPKSIVEEKTLLSTPSVTLFTEQLNKKDLSKLLKLMNTHSLEQKIFKPHLSNETLNFHENVKSVISSHNKNTISLSISLIFKGNHRDLHQQIKNLSSQRLDKKTVEIVIFDVSSVIHNFKNDVLLMLERSGYAFQYFYFKENFKFDSNHLFTFNLLNARGTFFQFIELNTLLNLDFLKRCLQLHKTSPILLFSKKGKFSNRKALFTSSLNGNSILSAERDFFVSKIDRFTFLENHQVCLTSIIEDEIESKELPHLKTHIQCNSKYRLKKMNSNQWLALLSTNYTNKNLAIYNRLSSNIFYYYFFWLLISLGLFLNSVIEKVFKTFLGKYVNQSCKKVSQVCVQKILVLIKYKFPHLSILLSNFFKFTLFNALHPIFLFIRYKTVQPLYYKCKHLVYMCMVTIKHHLIAPLKHLLLFLLPHAVRHRLLPFCLINLLLPTYHFFRYTILSFFRYTTFKVWNFFRYKVLGFIQSKLWYFTIPSLALKQIKQDMLKPPVSITDRSFLHKLLYYFITTPLIFCFKKNRSLKPKAK